MASRTLLRIVASGRVLNCHVKSFLPSPKILAIPSLTTTNHVAIDPRWSAPSRHVSRKGDFYMEDLTMEDDLMGGNFKPWEFDDVAFEGISEATLEYLCEYLDECVETYPEIAARFDIVLSQGVLTVKCGSFGTFVINKQGPNKQIWLSSPFSGPKRYDWDEEESQWAYRGQTLTSLLTEDFEKVFGPTVDFYHLNTKIKAFAHENYGGKDVVQ